MTAIADVLRPSSLAEFVGQVGLRRELEVEIRAALIQRRPMDHLLLEGGPGVGKTSLASLVARELADSPFLPVIMPFGEQDLKALRTFAGGVLFIDECHRGSDAQKEELLSLLESGVMHPKGKFVITLPWLTVIGATTEKMKMSRALRERFIVTPSFDPYSDAEIATIGFGMASKVHVFLTQRDMDMLAVAAAGVPRVMSHLILAARNIQLTTEAPATAEAVLELRRLTVDGMRPDHVAYLSLLDRMGQNVGLKPMSEMMDMSEANVRDLERLLLRLELIERGPNGRTLTDAGLRRAAQLNKETS